jgi:putative addiction module component (TIGR02574 family)
MSAVEILEQIRRLPENERRELVAQILDEFTEIDDDLSPEQLEELERRAEDALKNPNDGIPWEDVQPELKKKFGWR